MGRSDLHLASLPRHQRPDRSGLNNLAKRIKRVAFGLVNFRHHRVRFPLDAGKPDWTLLPTIQP